MYMHDLFDFFYFGHLAINSKIHIDEQNFIETIIFIPKFGLFSAQFGLQNI